MKASSDCQLRVGITGASRTYAVEIESWIIDDALL